MGEIGIPRQEYLFELRYWEILLIVRGYARRNRDLWSVVRWQTYSLLAVLVDLKKAGIFSPTDLLSLPWDNDGEEVSPGPTKEQIAELQRQMREYNESQAEGKP